MAQVKLHRRTWLAVSAGTLSIVATMAMTAAVTGGASASMTDQKHPRPRASSVAASSTAGKATAKAYPVTSFVQDFSADTTYFCPAGSGNAPCDGNGAAGDYGTIDRVPSGFSNGGFGNYAPFTKALHGHWMALVSGTGAGNQGAGCPGTTPVSNPGESCTGPFALFGTGKARGVENVFPAKGFTVTNDLYLSPSTAAPAGSLADDDVELNLSAPGTFGYYGIDNIITACAEHTGVNGPMGFVINFGHGSAGSCSGTPVVTTDGWYRFVFMFSDVGGNADLTEFVRSEPTGALVATSGPQPVGGGSPTPIGHWGGPGYFWLPSLDMSGLPLANFALQLGQVPDGHKP
jgi:hypothetical protein